MANALFLLRPIVKHRMSKTKKILITTESFETFVLHVNSKGRAVARCSQCENEVEVLGIDQAVTTSGLRTNELIRRIEMGEIHGIETQAGHLLVCGDSLRTYRKGEENNEK